MKNKLGLIIVLLVCLVWACPPSSAEASFTMGFVNITGNNSDNTAAGESQLSVTLYGTRDEALDDGFDWTPTTNDDEIINQVLFGFFNTAPTGGVPYDSGAYIDGVYFDDGTLMGISSLINSSPDVDFSKDASPGHLPGGNQVGFVVTKSFSSLFTADAEPGAENGVNVGEKLGVIIDLLDDEFGDPLGYDDVVAALQGTSEVYELAVGVKVQGFAGGWSEGLVGDEEVPEPGSVLIWLVLALSGGSYGWWRRRSASR